MAFSLPSPQATIRAAGDTVEVIDAGNRLHGKRGVVAFFVGDNVYVTFAEVRWSRTRMFFRDQLRLTESAQPARRINTPPSIVHKLRVSLQRSRS